MAYAQLQTYLNDHLAGSSVGLELLANIASAFAGTDIEPIVRQIHDDVAADRRQLESLMERLAISQSVPKKASAWMAEKAVQLKLRVSDPATGPFRLLESTEAVTIGVEGKRLLWRALSAAAEVDPKLRGLNYEDLIRRAEDQRRRLEEIRIKAARTALTAESDQP